MRKGFTLIELMIVVAIIAIIAAIAIPNLLESRMQANETNAVAALKQYATAQAIYKKANYGGVTANSNTAKYYVATWRNLGSTSDSHVNGAGTALTLISIVFGDASTTTNGYQGYYFLDQNVTGLTIPLSYNYSFGLFAIPGAYSKTGINNFHIDGQGTVRMRDLGTTKPTSTTEMDSNWVVP